MKYFIKTFGYLVLAAVLLLSLTACGGKTPENDTTITVEPLTETQKQSLDTSLDTALTVPESEKADDPAFLTEMEKKNGYEVLSAESQGDTVTATIRVFAPDLSTIAKQVDAQSSGKSKEELLEAIQQAVAAAEPVEKTITVEFEKNGDTYTPLITAEFFDAYYGGIFQLYDQLLTTEKTEG